MNCRLVKWLLGSFGLDEPRSPRLALPGDAESDLGEDPEARLELVRNVDGLTGDPANAPPIETPLAIPTLVQRSAPG